jgi:hypothetical protein
MVGPASGQARIRELKMATKPKKSTAAPVGQAAEAVAPVSLPATVQAAAAMVEAAPLSASKFDELAELGRQNLSAVMKANEAFSEGLEAIGKELVGYARTSFEQASHAATALLGAKTLEEVVQLNADLARAGAELLLKRSAKLSEMGMSVATQTLAPLGSRVEAAFALATRSQAA